MFDIVWTLVGSGSHLKFKDRNPQVLDEYVHSVIDPSIFHNSLPWIIFLAFVLVAIGMVLPEDKSPLKIFGLGRKGNKRRPNRSESNELGSADFATAESLAPWLKKNNQLDTCLPVYDLKGSEGTLLKDGELVFPSDERNRHILMVAKTGSGKTTKAILPILYNDCLCPMRSTIVLDSKPEMWDKLVGLTRKYNPKKNILLFNPLDTMRSLSWNILGKIETDTDAKLIANSIISATDDPNSRGDSPFFRNNAYQILYSIMLGLLEDPNEKISMPRIHQLVHSGMHKLCDWLEVHPNAARNTRTFIELARSGSQNADTIMSELAMRLSAWDLKAIRSTTFTEELNLDELIDKPTLLIIELRESELEMLRPLANVIVVEIMRYLTKRSESYPGGKLPRPVGFVIDEFASALGRLPEVHVKLNTLRSRNVSFVAAIQSISQIKANYKDNADSVLAGFSTKILMPALDFLDAEWASKETGTMTVRYQLASKGKNRRLIDHFAHKSLNTQEQVQQRAVLTPDEIGKPVDNAATFFLPNMPVFQGQLKPYYKVSQMAKRFETKAGDFKLREQPLDYIEVTETKPEDAQQQAPAEEQLSEEQLRSSINEFKVVLEWDKASKPAQDWWESFEEANASNLQLINLLAKEIAVRDSTIEDFYAAFSSGGGERGIEGVLYQLDWMRYYRLKIKAGWENANEHTREWWARFESDNQGQVSMMITLVQDLITREATVNEFFSVYVHQNVETIPQILDILEKTKAQRKEKAALASLDAVVRPHSTHDSSPQEQSYAHQRVKVEDEEMFEEQTTDFYADPFADEDIGEDLTSDFRNIAEESGTIAETTGRSIHSSIEQTSSVKAPERPRSRTAKDAALRVHVEGFFEMAEGFVKAKNFSDYRMLLELAKDDPMVNQEDIAYLESLSQHF